MNSILIVDDEIQIRELIKKYAQHMNYLVFEAENGLEAIEIVKKEKIDLIIMDIMMPELDGFSSVKAIREFSSLPIIMLSARGEEYDKIYGFDLGIDDYVTKPFSPKELMMRVNAILQRSYPKKEEKNWIFENLEVKFDARLVYINHQKIDLTLKEYELLVFLISNPNIALTREQLLQKVWGDDFVKDERTLDTHIKSLRKKIEPYGNNIVTIRRVGYRFED